MFDNYQEIVYPAELKGGEEVDTLFQGEVDVIVEYGDVQRGFYLYNEPVSAEMVRVQITEIFRKDAGGEWNVAFRIEDFEEGTEERIRESLFKQAKAAAIEGEV